MRFILLVLFLITSLSAFAQSSRDERYRYSQRRQDPFGRNASRVDLQGLVDEAADILTRAIANSRDRRFRPMLRGLRLATVRQAPEEIFDEACDSASARASVDPRNPRVIDICPAFYRDDHDYQLTIILHEAFHVGGNPGSRRGEVEKDASRAAQDVRVAAGMDAGLDS